MHIYVECHHSIFMINIRAESESSAQTHRHDHPQSNVHLIHPSSTIATTAQRRRMNLVHRNEKSQIHLEINCAYQIVGDVQMDLCCVGVLHFLAISYLERERDLTQICNQTHDLMCILHLSVAIYLECVLKSGKGTELNVQNPFERNELSQEQWRTNSNLSLLEY